MLISTCTSLPVSLLAVLQYASIYLQECSSTPIVYSNTLMHHTAIPMLMTLLYLSAAPYR